MPAKPAKKQHAIFRQVCELIPPHLVAKLAREFGVRTRGISPWSHSNRTVQAIAADLGYNSMHSFTRLFTKHIGMSPGLYRKRMDA